MPGNTLGSTAWLADRGMSAVGACLNAIIAPEKPQSGNIDADLGRKGLLKFVEPL